MLLLEEAFELLIHRFQRIESGMSLRVECQLGFAHHPIEPAIDYRSLAQSIEPDCHPKLLLPESLLSIHRRILEQ